MLQSERNILQRGLCTTFLLTRHFIPHISTRLTQFFKHCFGDIVGIWLHSFLWWCCQPERVVALQARGQLFLEQARSCGIDTGTSAGLAVIPVITGSSIRAARLATAMFERGINVLPILYPAVPEKTARLRFFVSCRHTEEQIRATVQAVAEELNRL